MLVKQSVVKRKKNPGFLIPLVLALLVTALFYEGSQWKTKTDIHPVSIPVAKVDLPQHALIKATDIVMITIPIKGVSPIMITDPKEIIGKYVGTQYTIPKNGYFYKSAVSTLADIPSNISMMLGPNQLGVTLQMNLEKTVANSLTPDQDVQVRFFTNKTPNQQPFEGVLFDHLKILALRNGSGVNVTNTDDQKTTQVPTVVVFQANDEQVSYLIRAQSLGALNIVAIPKQAAESTASADTSKTSAKDGTTSSTDKTNSTSGADGTSGTSNSNNGSNGNAQSGTASVPASKDTNNGAQSSSTAQLSPDAIKAVLAAGSKTLTPDQLTALQKALSPDQKSTLEGHLYQKNAAELLIDSMSYAIQKLFAKTGIMATPDGEIVYFDAATNQIRYFKDKTEYQDSAYALTQLTPDQIAKLKQDGKLTDAQIQALAQQQQSFQEPKYSTTTKGEIYQIINGQAVFPTDAEVIDTLTALKQKNGSLNSDNQALLSKLQGNGTGKGTGASNGTSPSTSQPNNSGGNQPSANK